MSTDFDSVFHPKITHRPGWMKALPWVIGSAVVGCLIAVGIIWSNTGHSNASVIDRNKPAVDVSKVPPKVKLAPGATKVARTFIETAVARKNLRVAYTLVTEQIRQGQSLKSWMTGNIAVVPYPVDAIRYAPMKIDFSYPREAQIEIAMLPKKGSNVKPLLFMMDLVKRGDRWLVNSWVPRATPRIPVQQVVGG